MVIRAKRKLRKVGSDWLASCSLWSGWYLVTKYPTVNGRITIVLWTMHETMCVN